MQIIIWKYEVKPSKLNSFISHYSSEGTWARLFQRSPEYLGTEFGKVDGHDNVYITIDRWKSQNAFEAFKAANRDEYEKLDELCGEFTVTEQLVGSFSN